MNFHQIILILVARRRLVLTVLLSTIFLVGLATILMPKTYKGTATVLLNYKGVDPLTGLTLPGQLLPGYMATQIDIMTSKNVALKVIDSLKLDQDKANIEKFNSLEENQGSFRSWLATNLIKKLEIVPSRESSVVEINFKGRDPDYVARVANAFATEYQNESVQLRVEPMQKASAFFDEQTKKLRDAVEVAQKKISLYEQQHGITNIDDKLDVESKRLSDLSTMLVAAQGMSMEANSRATVSSLGGFSDSPDIVASPLIQNLKAQLSIARSKFADLSARLDRNHPQYISAQAEIRKLNGEIQEQIAITTNSVKNNAAMQRQREASIRAALTEQKKKVLDLNHTREDMAVMIKDLEAAQKALATSSERFSQTKIEGQSQQSDISILNPATPPIEASSPKPFLNILLSIILGTVFGSCAAMIAELLNRQIRSESDLVFALNVPVLGVIQSTAPNALHQEKLGLSLPRRLGMSLN